MGRTYYNNYFIVGSNHWASSNNKSLHISSTLFTIWNGLISPLMSISIKLLSKVLNNTVSTGHRNPKVHWNNGRGFPDNMQIIWDPKIMLKAKERVLIWYEIANLYRCKWWTISSQMKEWLEMTERRGSTNKCWEYHISWTCE